AAAREAGAVDGQQEQVAVPELRGMALDASAERRQHPGRALVAEQLDVVPVLAGLDAEPLGPRLHHAHVCLVADERAQGRGRGAAVVSRWRASVSVALSTIPRKAISFTARPRISKFPPTGTRTRSAPSLRLAMVTSTTSIPTKGRSGWRTTAPAPSPQKIELA